MCFEGGAECIVNAHHMHLWGGEDLSRRVNAPPPPKFTPAKGCVVTLVEARFFQTETSNFSCARELLGNGRAKRTRKILLPLPFSL